MVVFQFFLCSKGGEGKGAILRSPHTPKAPRHGPRPPSRIKITEMRQIAAVLFQDSAFSSRCMVPSVLSKPLCKSLASNRVLFYEDELCQAVAQNKLRWSCWSHFMATFSLPCLSPYVYSLFPGLIVWDVVSVGCMRFCSFVGQC